MNSNQITRTFVKPEDRQYVPAFVGKSGHEVHAAFLTSKDVNSRGELVGETYGNLCTVVNTHNVNKHPRVQLARKGTEITCKKCLAKLAEIEAKNAELTAQAQPFAEELYKSLGMAEA